MTGEPVPHGEPELAAVIALLRADRPRIRIVTIGRGRDQASRAAAESFAAAWSELPDAEVADVVDWPEQAASWLRAARRITAGHPDAWVVAAAPIGFTQLARRLRMSTEWRPDRTFCFADTVNPHTAALARDALDGVRGVTRDGRTWLSTDGELRVLQSPR
jgi:hypothetical protein